MNKTIKYTVWALLLSILLSGFFLVKMAMGAEGVTQEMIVMSHQYNRVFADQLIKKILTIKKDSRIVLYLKDGKEIVGVFKSYSKSDESVWIEEQGWHIQSGYGVMELMDIRVLVRKKGKLAE